MHVFPSIYIYKINTQKKFFPHADAGTGDTSNGHEIKERFNMHLQRVDRHPMRTVLVCLAEQVLVAFNRVSSDAFPSPKNLSTCRNVTCHKPCSMSTPSPIWSMHAMLQSGIYEHVCACRGPSPKPVQDLSKNPASPSQHRTCQHRQLPWLQKSARRSASVVHADAR